MPPSLALFLWFLLLLALLRFDPAKEPETRGALWIPVVWMFIVGSRLPSQWLGAGVASQAVAFEEGNPVDRAIYFMLIALAVGVLIARSFRWHDFFRHNFPLVMLLAFALFSVAWSDFHFVAFKRWFRDFGNYLMILVVVSDPRPMEAVATVIRRLSYLLIPLSVVLVKYYVYLAIHYSFYSGVPEYVGAATSKNTLGVVCLISGIYFFWDTVTRWRVRKEKGVRRIILLNLIFIGMTLWLLNLSSSATSTVCLVIGCLIILGTHGTLLKRNPGLLKALIPACLLLYAILAYGFDINTALAAKFGRDPTLTGRNNIWNAVLSVHTNPLVGTGYQSFWLGTRLNQVWKLAGPVNEAHNGYLEIYLSLGVIGVFLLLVFMVMSFRTICNKLVSTFSFASLALALWTITFFYNMTESAAFNGQPLWVIFLLVLIVISVDPSPAAATIPAREEPLAYRRRGPVNANAVSPMLPSESHCKGTSRR
jgi:O-antigen ligase